MTSVLAYTCHGRYGEPFECGAGAYYFTQGFRWLLVGLFLLVLAFWAFTKIYGRWDDRPAARRRRALEKLDRAARERERRENPPPEVPEPFRRRSGNQPW